MANKALQKRIVSGRFKGVALALPSLTHTRSSKAIVLESFFNTIQFDIINAHFVELFSGSGSIGLEALSRGANRVTFFEREASVLKVLKHNIAKTSPQACEVIAGDTFEQFRSFLKRLDEPAYFYIDPPFNIREGMDDIYEKSIALIKNIAPKQSRLIAVEHSSEITLPSEIGAFAQSKHKKFGKTSLTYYKEKV